MEFTLTKVNSNNDRTIQYMLYVGYSQPIRVVEQGNYHGILHTMTLLVHDRGYSDILYGITWDVVLQNTQ